MKSCIKVLGSGSRGNCIIVFDNRGKSIIIDLGVKFKNVLKALDYDISGCSGALVSHIHCDHSKYIDDCIGHGIPVYANEDVCAKYPKCKAIDSMSVGNLGGFTVRTFSIAHNVENNAFVIDTYDGIRLLYITDAQNIQYRVKRVNYAIVECNHEYGWLIENVLDSVMEIKSQYYNHLSLEDCIDYLKAIYNPELQGILLWHMSSENIDDAKARKQVIEELSFKDVYIGKNGLEIPMRKEEF